MNAGMFYAERHAMPAEESFESTSVRRNGSIIVIQLPGS